ncbi:MOSC N-terminal beta barrel domain-containing protein [Amycolatopsis acidiphila]|uniref:MOSC domain-containing protein n=1 Tax=Amycolatopsis acidiphila TaxID=715473 RepID=A0A558AE07_9PSEU|nr:MOSC N-terminal beta barrel domain-containing protein [Amycolatopsis acidiphila]TVT22500.1 MOSC domain-containing protein [Amycolatopsis acidiphila]UIJ58863.1 MOSC N-terminal beta barrel domain-containing protein [Amycolatopsis acidiphila]GHG72427.1 molybdenum cofactor sulfurase [Amycolatopsis acidiphila]
MFSGSVVQLHRWPVKSLRGERVEAARFDDRGMAGDRAHALIDLRPKRTGKVLTIRQNPGLLSWHSAYRGPAEEPPTLRAPDGTDWSWIDPRLPAALSESLGVPLELRNADGMQDRGPTVLVTIEASRAALADELGAAVDLARFRPNLHLTLDAPAFAEESWGEGTTLTVGDVILEAVGEDAGPCIRCVVPSWDPAGRDRWPKLQTWLIEQHENKFGLIMRVTRPGTVRAGDEVWAQPL